jgi:RimJ/RimL family protein N-acetyltransferase
MSLTLQTPRLSLRPHRADDLDDYAAMWAEPEVVRYVGGRPSSRQESWARLLRQVGHWQLLGFGYWILKDRESGRLVGEAGFANFERDLEPPLGDAPEAGWIIATWAHGRGYATEATRAILAWGDDRFRGERSVCIIDPANAASLRVAEKCGFTETHRTSYVGDPIIVMERRFAPDTAGTPGGRVSGS